MSADEKETQDLKLLDDDDPSILSQQIFQILKEAVLSKGEPSPGASAKRIDSLLKANVGLVTEEGGAITSKGFSFVVGMMLVQTAIQLPAEKDKQHERLGEVILALTRIPERMDGDQIFAWSKLPFIEGEFEDRWHREFLCRSREMEHNSNHVYKWSFLTPSPHVSSQRDWTWWGIS